MNGPLSLLFSVAYFQNITYKRFVFICVIQVNTKALTLKISFSKLSCSFLYVNNIFYYVTGKHIKKVT